MKEKEREEARRLRSEEGLSVGEIAKRLGVSKGTSSRWLRDVELTESQRLRLEERARTSPGQQIASMDRKNDAQKKREECQRAGRELARDIADTDYKLFCALYWAEGDKSRWTVGMSNTDVGMLSFFVNGLKKYFGCQDDDFTVRVIAHLNNGLTVEQINDYWLKELGLPESCLGKFILKSKYYPVQNKKHKKHIYGGCHIRIGSTDIIQKIYGSIQEIFKIERPEWLWG